MSKKRTKFMKGDVVLVELNTPHRLVNWIYPPDSADGSIFVFIKTETVNQNWGSWYGGNYTVHWPNPKRIHTFLDQDGVIVEFGNSGKKIKVISRAQKNVDE